MPNILQIRYIILYNYFVYKVIRHGDGLITDLYVKPIDTHQYLNASSYHVYHSKRSIPYSQALRLYRISLEPDFFDHRCNQLEEWLDKRCYKQRMVQDQILKARKPKRKDLLFSERPEKTSPDLVLNITYHPAFARPKSILFKIHILLNYTSLYLNDKIYMIVQLNFFTSPICVHSIFHDNVKPSLGDNLKGIPA